MGKLMYIVTSLHKKTSRNYIGRMCDNKVEAMVMSRKYDKEYWDGNRRYGYGGYKYDGRWETVARMLIDAYKLPKNAKILDVACGKSFLLYEFRKLLPECTIKGFDISEYAIRNAKEEVKENLFVHRMQDPYPFKDKEFDLVLCISSLQNIYLYELKQTLKEIERTGKNKFIVVEAYRNEQELFNLECWVLTGNLLLMDKEWTYLFNEFGYTGDYEFTYFE